VSFYLATGPSPLGARWIQEHFVLFGAQETNSYVGPCNRLAFNVGLHNENNDFTGVPWHRLPELRRRASEFYADQPVVRSYLALCWRFVMDPTLSIGSRMVRPSRGGWR
jgi:sphingolipid delta-4 desaturase